jgi:hypothetical protein
MKVILPIYLFPPIEYLQILQKADEVLICAGEYFKKQTYHNRFEIATANGKHRLTVPVEGSKNHRNLSTMQIHYKENWPQIHQKTIASAYKNSPYFDYFESDLKEILFSRYGTLIELSLCSLKFLEKGFKTKFHFTIQKDYIANYSAEWNDLRAYVFDGTISPPPTYLQPFSDRTGFIPNLSGLDLLFCSGPNSLKTT